MTLRNIHETFSSEGNLTIGFTDADGWYFVGKNVELGESKFFELYSEHKVDWIYLNNYQDVEGLAVVLK